MADQRHGESAEGSAAPPTILGCFGDLMLTVRVEAAARAIGLRLLTVAGVGELGAALTAAEPRAVVLDLTAPAFPLETTMHALRRPDGGLPFVLAFFPHVERGVGRAARLAGCTLVVPRSRFMAELPALLSHVAGGQPTTDIASGASAVD